MIPLITLAIILAMSVIVTHALPLQAPIVVATGSRLCPCVAHDSQTAPVRQVMARGTILAIFLAACMSFLPLFALRHPCSIPEILLTSSACAICVRVLGYGAHLVSWMAR